VIRISDLINTRENRNLLREYLYRDYLKNGSTHDEAVMRTNRMMKGKNLFGKNGVAHSLGARSFEFFCLYYLQDTFQAKPTNTARKLGDFHFEIWNTLDDMFIKDEFDKLSLCMPRGSSKTTTVNFALSTYLAAYGISYFTLVAGKKEDDAVEFINDTRKAFVENPYIINTFGHMLTRSIKLKMYFSNGCKIQAISSGTSIRGLKHNGVRPTCIIGDDYQSAADVITQEARDKKYNTWTQDAEYAGDDPVYRDGKKVKMATKFIMLGTILHRDCLISRILKDSQYKRIVKKAVLVDDIDELFNSGKWAELKKIRYDATNPNAEEDAKKFYLEHEEEMKFPVLWEDKYDCYDLAVGKYYPNPSAFKQEMMNDASKLGQKAFHDIKTLPRKEIEKEKDNFIKTILCCDPAVEVQDSHDYSAFIVGSKTPNNFRWVRKACIERLEYDDYIAKVISLLKEYPDITHLWIEKNVFSGADVRDIQREINKDRTLTARDIQIINEHQTKNKEAKIRAIGGKVDSGFIVFPQEDKEFTDQIMAYEGEKFTRFDDAPDITAEFDRLIDELQEVQYISFLDRSALF